MDEAIDVANDPEHLTLSVDEPFDYLENSSRGGALLGPVHSSVGCGLCRWPESRLADWRDSALLWHYPSTTTLRSATSVHYTREELSKVKDHLVRLAHIEGFDAPCKMAEQGILMKKNGSAPRQASIHRATKETDIHVEWMLDGSGQGKIDTGIRFFRPHAVQARFLRPDRPG